jgi:hypothetical protein
MPAHSDIRFWSFTTVCMQRAFGVTVGYLDWDLKTLIVGALCLVTGYLLYYGQKGFISTQERTTEDLLLIIVPVCSLGVVTFLVNVVRSPFLVYKADIAEADEQVRSAQEKESAIRAELEEKFKPKFVMSVQQAVICYSPDRNHTLDIPYMEILNKGQDSVAISYRVRYKSKTLDADVELNRIGLGEFRLPLPNKTVYTLRQQEIIQDRTITQAIQRGHIATGRLLISVPGNKVEEIGRGDATLTIFVRDYLNNEFSTIYRSSANPSDRFLIGPGETLSSQ